MNIPLMDFSAPTEKAIYAQDLSQSSAFCSSMAVGSSMTTAAGICDTSPEGTWRKLRKGNLTSHKEA